MALRFTDCLRLTAPLCAAFAFAGSATAAVLPEDRADTMYHFYDGGGVQIDGPSVLMRKSIKETVSLFGNYYVDSITSASIDVVTTGASPYEEEREEYSLGADYLHDATIMSFVYTDSQENDYQAQSLNFSIAQDMFGGLTTVSMGYGRGSDEIFRNGPDGQPDGVFMDEADRRNYRVSVTQVLTRNTLLGVYYEAITDEGFLNNPYRQTRYLDPGSANGYSFQAEVYPRTRSSNAASLNLRYHLPFRGALHGGTRFFTDTWGIDAYNVEFGYTHGASEAWILDLGYRFYSQTSADFFQDLFPYADSQNFLARDKELATFSSHSLRFGISYDLVEDGWRFVDKARMSFSYDHMIFNYDDFRDLRGRDANGAPLYAPGTEPLYSFTADVIQFYFSIWF
ncbi:MAG: DUF3570 domain-containing protein [Gammaproteobacteria bacterium]